ncbi:hypothetical protein ACEK07_46050 [Alcanivoracaceae bacterium MT1]
MADQLKAEIHDKIMACVEEIWREHRVRVEAVYCDWIDVSSPAKQRHVLNGVSINSTKRGDHG